MQRGQRAPLRVGAKLWTAEGRERNEQQGKCHNKGSKEVRREHGGESENQQRTHQTTNGLLQARWVGGGQRMAAWATGKRATGNQRKRTRATTRARTAATRHSRPPNCKPGPKTTGRAGRLALTHRAGHVAFHTNLCLTRLGLSNLLQCTIVLKVFSISVQVKNCVQNTYIKYLYVCQHLTSYFIVGKKELRYSDVPADFISARWATLFVSCFLVVGEIYGEKVCVVSTSICINNILVSAELRRPKIDEYLVGLLPSNDAHFAR